MNLDDIAAIPTIQRLTWHIDEEPKHLPKSSYYKAYMPITGIAYLEESDDQYRKRLLKNIRSNIK